MTTSTTFPNGQVLQSSAYTPSQLNIFLQALTCGMLGVISVDPARVRVSWQEEGQPFENAKQDVCYLACVPEDVGYSRVRDREYSGAGPVTETWTYTKGWRITWNAYGPTSEDNMRVIRSCMFLDYWNDQLNLGNLYPVNDPPEVVRLPELINGQWFERADFHIDMYEKVTETIQDTIVTSVEIKIYDGDPEDPVADFTVPQT